MLNYEKTSNISASLVEKISLIKLNENDTLKDFLRFNDISLWDVFACELAHRYILNYLIKNQKYHYKIFLKFFYYNLLNSNFLKTKNDSLLSSKSLNKGKNIIFFAFSERMYRDVLHKVATILSENNDNKIIVLGLREFKTKYLNNKENLKYLILPEIKNQEAKYFNIKLKKFVKDKRNYFSKNNIYNLLSKKFPMLSTQDFKLFFNEFFLNLIPLNGKFIFIANYFLDKVNTHLMISPDTSDSRIRIFKKIAQNRNIPIIDVQHGIAGREAVEWRFNFSNKVAVWGRSSKETMINFGIDRKKIKITGCPRNEFFSEKYLKSNKKINTKKINLLKPKLNILLASTFFDNDHRVFYKEGVLDAMKKSLLEIVATDDYFNLTVKPHPHEDVKKIISLVGNKNSISFLSSSGDIRENILNCSVFISFGTTATFDALLQNKLIICPFFNGWQFSKLFVNSKVCLFPKNEKELKEIFNNLKANGVDKYLKKLKPYKDKFIRDHMLKGKIKASELIVELINDHLSKNKL